MKLIILGLLLVNTAIFAYFNLPQSHNVPTNHDLATDKVTLLSTQTLQAMPKKEDSTTSSSTNNVTLSGCYVWESFSEESVALAKNILTKLSINAEEKKEPVVAEDLFWVYIPPLANARITEKMANKLRIKGIQDFVVMQEVPWKNAISFGMFKDELLATNLFEALKSQGVSSVVKGTHKAQIEDIHLQLKEVTPSTMDQLKKLSVDFPYAKIKEVDCSVF